MQDAGAAGEFGSDSDSGDVGIVPGVFESAGVSGREVFTAALLLSVVHPQCAVSVWNGDLYGNSVSFVRAGFWLEK